MVSSESRVSWVNWDKLATLHGSLEFLVIEGSEE